MSKKGKRRREARRARRERETAAARPEAPPEAAAPPGEERERPAAAVTLSQRRAAAPRRRARRAGGLRVSPWLVAAPVVAVVVAVVAVLVMTAGSSGSGGGDGGGPNVDPRVVGLTPTVTFTIEARGAESGSSYAPNTITAKAADVIEIIVKNTGSVSHNMRVSGPNKVYDVDTSGNKGDDFEMRPNVVQPGKSEPLVVKIDQPGEYPFRCDFHPLDQVGTLILQ